ncbi:MmcQ/YjbR family DNA-binding protein [Lysobacter sp. UC]|uniref:MmcQ/YjbR family DNA-binding protein n=1 Tax=Lysobacter arvi TaxID=3038776 RepID=A0ABU1CIF9_9GAMM|nr:MmcQ/YjbR family DNA-binding protein [Lysobacter arvi]
MEASIKWGEDLVFSVAGKMFCVTRAHGEGAVSFKVEDDRFLELTERPGFQPAPYLARSHWVMVAQPGRLAPEELRALLRRSYELVRAKLPKKTQRELAD